MLYSSSNIKDKVEVTTMVSAGADAHTYELLPEQLKEISSAKMYVMLVQDWSLKLFGWIN